MRSLYFVPTATLETTPPRGGWHALQCPGTPAWSLCVVEAWNDGKAMDEWEDQQGVRPLYPEMFGQVVPPVAVQAFGAWGVVATDTIRQALRKIRAQWGAAHP